MQAELRGYINTKNMWCELTNTQPIPTITSRLTPDHITKLENHIEADLSPENLSCDGELRGAQLKDKTLYLQTVRHQIENLRYR